MTAEKCANEQECKPEVKAPLVDQMCLVNAPEHDVGPENRPLSNLPPFWILQMLGINEHQTPLLAALNLCKQLPSHPSSVCDILFAVRECGYTELFGLFDLSKA
jgi:hypothetical protein